MPEFLKDILSNHIILVPLMSWMVCQIIKFLISSVSDRKLRWERLFGDGGMPSGHSSVVMSMTAICAWLYGCASPLFAISGVVAVIVMRDAMGVRRETGKQTVSIKAIAEQLNFLLKERDVNIRTEKLKEFVGHTPLQVFFGMITGILVVVAYCWIRGIAYKSGIAF